MRHLAFLSIALVALTGSGDALAAAAAGKAVGVNPSAIDQIGAASRTLTVGADVAMGDKIVTGPTGQVQLIFNDDTHLVVGPSSSLVVESYLLRGDKSVGQFAVNALGGTFRFITGKSDHDAYTIATPTGTIGVRGTAFDFTVAPKGQAKPLSADQFLPGTTVALFRGAVVLCNLKNECVTLTRKCEVGTITDPKTFKIGLNDAVDQGLRQRFRYIASQKPLLQPFWVDESRLCFLGTDPGSGLSTVIQGGPTIPRPRGQLAP